MISMNYYLNKELIFVRNFLKCQNKYVKKLKIVKIKNKNLYLKYKNLKWVLLQKIKSIKKSIN